MKKRAVLGHQLALTEGLNLTPDALRRGLTLMKSLGYVGMIVVPAAWDKSLTAKIAAEIARELGMWLQVCGFLPGDKFQPHSVDGFNKSLDELRRQLAFLIEFKNAGCGGDILCGPVDIGWKSTSKFNLEGYMKWIKTIDTLAESEKVLLAIEPLNEFESNVPKAFVTLQQTIVSTSCSRTHTQYDTGHAHLRGVTMEEFRAMKDQIIVFEFANVGRNPLSHQLGINFLAYSLELPSLGKGCVFGAEPFEPEGVGKPLGLGKLCTTTTSGADALKFDADYLQNELGVMAS